VKASERPRKRASRPKAVHRPVLQFRVHPDVYADLKKTAADLKLTISEEAARRLDRYADYIEAYGDIQKWMDDSREVLKRGFEAALREAGYTPISIDQGRIWAEPGMDFTRLSRSVDAQAVVRAMEPELSQILARAIEKTIGKGGQR
jgi:hypothetical protein